MWKQCTLVGFFVGEIDVLYNVGDLHIFVCMFLYKQLLVANLVCPDNAVVLGSFFSFVAHLSSKLICLF